MGTQRRRPQRKKNPSLSDALFSKTRQRVFALLFGHPERSFFTKEIIRATGGAGTAQRELEQLEKSEVIKSFLIGNQKHYQANRESPVFEELRSIVAKTFGIADPIRDALAPLANRINVAAIYGSVAKAEDRAASDIDLLVVGHDLTLEELFSALRTAESATGRRINPTLYSPEEFHRRQQKKNPFLENVLRGKTITLIGDFDRVATAR